MTLDRPSGKGWNMSRSSDIEGVPLCGRLSPQRGSAGILSCNARPHGWHFPRQHDNLNPNQLPRSRKLALSDSFVGSDMCFYVWRPDWFPSNQMPLVYCSTVAHTAFHKPRRRWKTSAGEGVDLIALVDINGIPISDSLQNVFRVREPNTGTQWCAAVWTCDRAYVLTLCGLLPFRQEESILEERVRRDQQRLYKQHYKKRGNKKKRFPGTF